MTGITALGGPLGNLAAALLGWCALRVLPASALRWRLCALLLAALSIFWAAGYLVYAMIKKFGDYALAAHELLPVSPQIWQPAGIILGILLYAAATRMIVRKAGGMVGANAAGTFQVAWLCATMLAIAAAALYRPDPLGAVIQAGLEIGAASFPLIYVGRRITSPPQAITRSVPWIMGAAIVFGMFALSLGRGLV